MPSFVCRCALTLISVAISPPLPTASPQLSPLRAAEEGLAAALTSKDAVALERLLAPGFVLRGAPDVPRATWIENALSLCWGDRYEMSDFAVVSENGNTAVVTLLLTTHQDPLTCERAVVRSLMTDVWIRQGGAWRLSLRHSAPPAATVSAQFDKVAPPPPRWERTAELSLLSTGGNTDTETIGAGASVTWRPGVWTTSGRAAYVRSAIDTAVTAESLLAEIRQARALSPRADLFARAEYLVDRFAGIDNRTALGAGFGWLLLDRAAQTLKVDGSLGVTHESRLAGEDLTFAAGTTSAIFTWRISRSATLSETAVFSTDLAEPDSWRLQNGLHLTAAMTRLFSVRIGHELKQVNRPVPGFRGTDIVMSAALVARF